MYEMHRINNFHGFVLAYVAEVHTQELPLHTQYSVATYSVVNIFHTYSVLPLHIPLHMP